VSEDPRATSPDPALRRESYLRRYLRISPVPLALWRAIEAKYFAQAELADPVLDLGCGFGEFASVFFDNPVAAGIDIRRADLVRAIRGQRYKSLCLADAREMPFLDETFATVISVSVLEHIPRLQEAVAETYRVLRKGGAFVFTATTPKFNDFLFFNSVLKKARLSPLGRLYVAVLTRAFNHASLVSQEDWLSLLERTGFQVEQQRLTISRRALVTFELTVPLATTSQVRRLLLGNRGPRRPDFLVNFWERRLAKYVDEDEDDGCNLFVIARKP